MNTPLKYTLPRSTEIASIARFTLLLALLLLIVFLLPQPLTSLFKRSEKELLLNGSLALEAFLLKNSATLSTVRKTGVSGNFLSSNLPGDLSNIPAEKRTSLFISLVLAHAVKCNEAILTDRKKLIRYILDIQMDKPLSPERKRWFLGLAQRYRIPAANPDTLLKRVDIIPVSLAIAQAITESGWGTSRFALQGNALYGQHLPQNSKKKFITSLYGNVKVAAFDSIYSTTAGYMHTLNTSKAYSDLRNIRSQLRSKQKDPGGYALAEGLLYYSEIGAAYIADIRFIIKKYKLEQLDKVQRDKYLPVMKIRFSRKKKTPETLLTRHPTISI